MKKITKNHLIIIIILWVTLLILSGAWNIYQGSNSQREMNIETARSLFEQILITREWNAQMGGVYVLTTSEVQPNPYLDVPNRDLSISDDVQVTLMNPAYMTRLISELAENNNRVKFHITSLNPIRPANAPFNWEISALESFENEKLKEYYFWDVQNQVFYYMAPLIVEDSCMKCHGKQGYEIGDIRGGISVSFEYQVFTEKTNGQRKSELTLLKRGKV